MAAATTELRREFEELTDKKQAIIDAIITHTDATDTELAEIVTESLPGDEKVSRAYVSRTKSEDEELIEARKETLQESDIDPVTENSGTDQTDGSGDPPHIARYNDLTEKKRVIVDAILENPDANNTELQTIASDALPGEETVSRAYVSRLQSEEADLIAALRSDRSNTESLSHSNGTGETGEAMSTHSALKDDYEGLTAKKKAIIDSILEHRDATDTRIQEIATEKLPEGESVTRAYVSTLKSREGELLDALLDHVDEHGELAFDAAPDSLEATEATTEEPSEPSETTESVEDDEQSELQTQYEDLTDKRRVIVDAKALYPDATDARIAREASAKLPGEEDVSRAYVATVSNDFEDLIEYRKQKIEEEPPAVSQPDDEDEEEESGSTSQHIKPKDDYVELTDKMKAIVDAIAENPEANDTRIAAVATEKLPGDEGVSRAYVPTVRSSQQAIINERTEVVQNERFEGEEKTTGDPFEGKLQQDTPGWQMIGERPAAKKASTESPEEPTASAETPTQAEEADADTGVDADAQAEPATTEPAAETEQVTLTEGEAGQLSLEVDLERGDVEALLTGTVPETVKRELIGELTNLAFDT